MISQDKKQKRYEFIITLGAEAETPEEAWEEACEAFSIDGGCMPDECTTEEIEEK
jgi:hypothetical protein